MRGNFLWDTEYKCSELIKKHAFRDLHRPFLHIHSHMVASTDGFMRGEGGKVD